MPDDTTAGTSNVQVPYAAADTDTKVAANNPDQITIELEKPIVIHNGNTTLTELTLKRPYSGHLRGVSVRDVLNFQTDALLTILPRITEPSFHVPFHPMLTIVDMVKIGDGIAYFLGGTPENADSQTE